MSIGSPSRWRVVFTWLFGFLLPAGTLFFESLTGFCAEHLFDPLPTLMHQVVVALVPLGFLFVLNVATPSGTRHLQLPFVLGVTLSISLLYTLPFVPLLGVAVIAVAYFGLGFLPLAPVLAFLVAASWIYWLAKHGAIQGLGRRVLMGCLVGVMCFAIADGRRIATHVGFELAASDHPASKQRGLRLLRSLGDEQEMLRLCLRMGPQGMLYSTDVVPETARDIYYRVTGRAVAPSTREDVGEVAVVGPFDDVVVTGNSTWPRIEGLALKSSQLSARLEPREPLAYVQWEMVFANSRSWAQEARAELALPTGARVSRVTLWVGGEPREAAFGGRSQVTAAYEDIAVVQRKDPLLVTTAGPDRVRLRAFPVPANGEMRLLLGVTAPLDLVRSIEGRLDLPYFTERNFGLTDGARHQIRLLDTGRALRLHAPLGLPNPFQMSDSELASFETFVAIHRDDSASAFWSGDDPESPEHVAHLHLVQRARPRHLVVVLDGSGSVANRRDELSTMFEQLHLMWPRMDVVFAADEVEIYHSEEGSSFGDLDSWLATRRLVGGRDNVPALLRGIELASEQTGGAVLWIGGAQPVELTSAERVEEALDDHRQLPPLFVFPLAPGAQRLWDAFEVLPRVVLPRYGDSSVDIRRFPGVDRERREYELDFAPPGTPLPPGATPASDHLGRMWSADEIQRLLRRGDQESTQEALRLAVEHQLVTPVSGAVVLETEEQYQAHDLEPVDPFTVPTIPEPEVWALILVAMGSLFWVYRKRSHQSTYEAKG